MDYIKLIIIRVIANAVYDFIKWILITWIDFDM